MGLRRSHLFLPLDQALVKALACAVIFETAQPLSGQSLADLTQRATTALGKAISSRRVEFERGGAWPYLAGWDVRRGYVLGRWEASTGITPFGRLGTQIMAHAPYPVQRIFWVVDNDSSHRGETSANALSQTNPQAILVHTPIPASWLNQVEIYFEKIQRKVLKPNDFANLQEIDQRFTFRKS